MKMFKTKLIFSYLNFLIYFLDCNEANDESATKPYTNKTIFKQNSRHSRGPPQQHQPPNIPPPPPYNYQNQNVRMPFQQPAVQLQPAIAQPPEIEAPPPYNYPHRIIRPIQQQHQQQQHQPIIDFPLPLQVHNLNQQERNQLQQAIANAEQYQPLFQQLFGDIQQNQQQYQYYQYPHAYYPQPQQQNWQHPPPAAQQIPVHYPQQNVQLGPQLAAQQPQPPPQAAAINPIQNLVQQQMSNYDQTRLVGHFQTHNPIDPSNEDEFGQAVRILDRSGVRPHVIAREYDVPEQTVRQHLERPQYPARQNRPVPNREMSDERRKFSWIHYLRSRYRNLPEVEALSAGLGNPPVYPVREVLDDNAQWRSKQKRYYTAKMKWRQKAMFGKPKKRRNRLYPEGHRQVVEFYEQQNPGFREAAPINRFGRGMPHGLMKHWMDNPQTIDRAFVRGIYDLYQYGSVTADYLQKRYLANTNNFGLFRRILDSRGVHLFNYGSSAGNPDAEQRKVLQAQQALSDHMERVRHDMSPELPPPIGTPELQQQLAPHPQAGAGAAIQHPPAANQFEDLTDDSDSDLVPQPDRNQPSTSGGMAPRGGRRRSPPRRIPSRTPSPVRPRLGIFSRNRPRGPAQIQGPPTGGLKRRTPPRSRSRSPAGGKRRMG